jgi:hypothetical protein
MGRNDHCRLILPTCSRFRWGSRREPPLPYPRRMCGHVRPCRRVRRRHVQDGA